MNGNNILVYSGGTPIAAMKSNEIQSESDLIEISTPTSSQWREFLGGRKSWSISVSYLVLADAGVKDLLKVGNTYTLKVKGRNASDADAVEGNAIMRTCGIRATWGNLVAGTFTFIGNGELAVPSVNL